MNNHHSMDGLRRYVINHQNLRALFSIVGVLLLPLCIACNGESDNKAPASNVVAETAVAAVKPSFRSVELDYSFTQRPYVSPSILQQLLTWMSDSGDQVVAYNLVGAQGFNEYQDDIYERDNFITAYEDYILDTLVGDEERKSTECGYRYIGQLDNGIHAIVTIDRCGGAAVFTRLLLVVLGHDTVWRDDGDVKVMCVDDERIFLKKVCEIPLGDRWSGKLKVDGNRIYVGKNKVSDSKLRQVQEGVCCGFSGWLDVNINVAELLPHGRMEIGETPFSFVEIPFVNPKLLEPLVNNVCPTGDRIIAIALETSQEANRFYGELTVRDWGVFPQVSCWEHGSFNPLIFGYNFVGKTNEGVYILDTFECGGGTGVFGSLLFLVIEKERKVVVDLDNSRVVLGNERIVMRKVGEMFMGDRWKGTVHLEGSDLVFAIDPWWFGDPPRDEDADPDTYLVRYRVATDMIQSTMELAESLQLSGGS